MAFQDLGTSTMVRAGAGPLAPAMAAHIQELAAKRANAEIAAAAKILKRVYRDEGIRLTDDEARQRVLADQHIFLAKGDQTRFGVTMAEPQTETVQAEIDTGTSVRFPSGYAKLITTQFGSSFLARLRKVAKETGIDPTLLVRIDPRTGQPRNPKRVAISYRAWNSRRLKYNLPEKERIAVPPDEQLRRSQRGQKAAQTKIQKLVEQGVDPEKARRELTKRATRKQRRLRREQDMAA